MGGRPLGRSMLDSAIRPRSDSIGLSLTFSKDFMSTFALRFMNTSLRENFQIRSGFIPIIENRPLTFPPSTDSRRKVFARPSANFNIAETGVSRSATKVVHTT